MSVPPSQEQLDRNLRKWFRAMEAAHELTLAGLRRKIGPDGDLQAAYRQWYRQQRDMAAERLERDAARWRQQQAEKSSSCPPA